MTHSRTLMLIALAALTGCGAGRGDDAEGDAAVGTEVGNAAPALEGTLPGGESFSLKPRETSLLVFYRGGYCGLCRERLAQLQGHLPEYRALGVRVLAVTPDPPEIVGQTIERLALEFPVVSVDSAVLRRWDVLGAPPDPAVPLPATYVVDADGLVRYRHLGRNAGDRVTDTALLAVLKRLTPAS